MMVSALDPEPHYEGVLEWYDLVVPLDHTHWHPWGWLPNACLGIDPERAWRTQLIDIARPGGRLDRVAWKVLIIVGPRKVAETEAVANDLILEDIESALREGEDASLGETVYQPDTIEAAIDTVRESHPAK